MRFAAIATTVAAIVVTPLAVVAAGPTMSHSEFLSAARCAGYEALAPQASNGWVQASLNAEARRQPAAIAEAATAEISAIAHEAAEAHTPGEAATLRSARHAACASAPSAMAMGGAEG